MRAEGLGFKVQGLGFRVPGSGSRLWVLGLRFQSSGFRVLRLSLRGSGLLAHVREERLVGGHHHQKLPHLERQM